MPDYSKLSNYEIAQAYHDARRRYIAERDGLADNPQPRMIKKLERAEKA